MERTRVLLLSMPTMLRELIRGIVQRDDSGVEVVGELEDARKLVEASASTRADALVLALPGPDLPAAYRRLLAERPQMHVLALVDEGRSAFRWELRRTALGELTPDLLRTAIRREWEPNGGRDR